MVAEIEAAEARAWADLYAAAPEDWAASVGLDTTWIGQTLVLRWAATGRRYFNRAIGLGVTAPATEAALDQVLDHWGSAGIGMCLVQSMPACVPGGYTSWLEARGLTPFERQDRVVRDAAPLVSSPTILADCELVVEQVTQSTADEWADFLQRVYRLDTGTWLQRLAGRPRWHIYLAREGGEIKAARSMYAGADGYAWWGMDCPVPGLMTPDYVPDAAVCEALVHVGLRHGVRWFLADIEAPSDTMDTPAYTSFSELGFTRPYVRTHWAAID